MRILLSNDDGYQAPGLKQLADTLSKEVEITVVAPERNCSGASNSLTLNHPLRAEVMDNGFIRVDGTPTDCVHLAITGLLEEQHDMVIAGINEGANLGDDTLYSGTVAAATEGRFLGLPAMAVSMASGDVKHYQTGAQAALLLLKGMRENPLPTDTILNVNVPDIPWTEIKGFRATRLGHRHQAEPTVTAHDPRGRRIYWVGAAGPEQDAGPGTDFFAIREKCVSVTPIQVDLTRHSQVDLLAQWLKEI
ncbi:MAG TPA: 5'/3'-nucleotidase SurE [Gammaproteobacteria bacterium]|nr:5'/3'-nucleotidase SurE [Gammaproteobacteria bacterium]